ncbi:MAG: hypothetical protein IJT91_03570 [Clostridia bacterium]|nr:hypothetical protein [Clostridia bacterium]
MKYLYSLMILSAAAGIVELIASGSRFEKPVRLVVSLCLCCALLLPVRSAVTGAGTLPGIDGDNGVSEKFKWDDSLLEEMIASNIENNIIEAIGNKFGFKDIECRVTAGKNERGEFIVEKVTVTFKDRGDWYRSADVKKYIEELVGSDTEVRLDDR